MSQKVYALLVCSILLVSLAACGGSAQPAQSGSAATPAVQEAATTTPAAAQATTPATQPAAGSAAASDNLAIFQINPANSKAQFTISEVLLGKPNIVVGTTSAISGEVKLDPKDLSTAQVGEIQVDAGSFVTDNDRRNGAIRRFILQTDQFPTITFTPASITGLSGSGEPGKSYTFQLAGDLKIRDVSHQQVFTVTVQADSPTQLTGKAVTTVKRADYNLQIPSISSVADVGEQAAVEFDFVADQVKTP